MGPWLQVKFVTARRHLNFWLTKRHFEEDFKFDNNPKTFVKLSFMASAIFWSGPFQLLSSVRLPQS